MRVTVSSQPNKIVSINSKATNEVLTVGIQGPIGIQGATSINNITDVNVSNLVDGSLLIYKASTQQWTASTALTAQNIDSGEF